MHKQTIIAAIVAVAFSLSLGDGSVAAAQGGGKLSPEGIWKTIDDETGKPKSQVKVWIKDGKLYGKIIKLIDPDDGDDNPLCDKCKGQLFNKPVVGMRIVNGLTLDDDVWEDGTILDPNNGKTYKCKIQVVEGGKKLKVRGYIGFSLIGRTQYWHRI